MYEVDEKCVQNFSHNSQEKIQFLRRVGRWDNNIKLDLKYREEPGWLSGMALGYGLDDRRFESR
jgi:hypothetical protein